jgi:hypothetical protein
MGDAQTAKGCHNILPIEEDSGMLQRSVCKWKEIVSDKNSFSKWKMNTDLW